MNDLTVKQLLRYEDEKKSMAVAYVLWGFVGPLGGHRFYLGKMGTAVAMLVLCLSIVGTIAAIIWWIVDAVLTHEMVKELNRDILAEITAGDRHVLT
ncbi:MAG: TM2 domain-containing protein [Gammaproteobacteria bacterium]|nr:TM2 domain-containing protein [Gammaproteobacteria bacterium]MYF38983.1 TM2 domain-containing protein [Gammaproteobacteria bacterium]